MSRPPAEETRAEVARQRLQQLAASFETRYGAAEPSGSHRNSVPASAPRPRLTARHLQVLGLLGVAALVLIGWWVLSNRGTGTPAVEDQVPFTAATAAVQNAAELIIDVEGAVASPGIVTVPAGSRVHDVIAAAGGVVGEPDTTSLNLAREVNDGEQILVGAAAQEGTTGHSGQGQKLSLNSASVEQLDALPGVGPVTAQAIVDWRTQNGSFRSVDDLLDVKGIGEATLGDLRDLVTA